MANTHIRLATLEDSEPIREIYAHYIPSSITFEEELPSQAAFQERVAHVMSKYPYLVAEQDGRIIGYAYAHEQAERAAYRWNAELSVYTAPKCGRKGLGTTLYQTLLELLKLTGVRKVFARVTMPNAASKRLHAKCGFKEEWTQKRAGWKNGSWHDVKWYGKQILPQPEKKGQEVVSPIPFPQVSADAVQTILDKANKQLASYSEKPLVSATTRKCMQGNKGSNTKPEQVVRGMLRDLGYPGYRLQWKDCPGKPDIAYPGRKVAIFVNGCFWHRCPVCNLPEPQSNSQYWTEKFACNVERDKRAVAALEEAGWKVATVWEHDLKEENREKTRQYLYEVVRLPEDK